MSREPQRFAASKHRMRVGAIACAVLFLFSLIVLYLLDPKRVFFEACVGASILSPLLAAAAAYWWGSESMDVDEWARSGRASGATVVHDDDGSTYVAIQNEQTAIALFGLLALAAFGLGFLFVDAPLWGVLIRISSESTTSKEGRKAYLWGLLLFFGAAAALVRGFHLLRCPVESGSPRRREQGIAVFILGLGLAIVALTCFCFPKQFLFD